MSEDRPDEALDRLFEDLEQQAEGIHLAERDAELVDRARGEYAAVPFVSRVHASVGREVGLTLLDGETVAGRLTGAGVDWCTVSVPGQQQSWLVRLQGIAAAAGLSARAVPEAARPALSRLSFGSALHRLGESASQVSLHLVTGRDERVRVVRIGADFVEVERVGGSPGNEAAVLVPFGAILGVRGRG